MPTPAPLTSNFAENLTVSSLSPPPCTTQEGNTKQLRRAGPASPGGGKSERTSPLRPAERRSSPSSRRPPQHTQPRPPWPRPRPHASSPSPRPTAGDPTALPSPQPPTSRLGARGPSPRLSPGPLPTTQSPQAQPPAPGGSLLHPLSPAAPVGVGVRHLRAHALDAGPRRRPAAPLPGQLLLQLPHTPLQLLKPARLRHGSAGNAAATRLPALRRLPGAAGSAVPCPRRRLRRAFPAGAERGGAGRGAPAARQRAPRGLWRRLGAGASRGSDHRPREKPPGSGSPAGPPPGNSFLDGPDRPPATAAATAGGAGRGTSPP